MTTTSSKRLQEHQKEWLRVLVGGMPVNLVAKHFGVSRGTVSRTLHSAEGAKYVQRLQEMREAAFLLQQAEAWDKSARDGTTGQGKASRAR